VLYKGCKGEVGYVYKSKRKGEVINMEEHEIYKEELWKVHHSGCSSYTASVRYYLY
jgi:hypothetical protein